jgi:sulfur carrier protein
MIHVNGDSMDWRPGLNVRDVLDARNYKFPLLIVSIDGAVVPRSDYNTTQIPDNTDVQVIHLTSGG